MNYLEKNEIQVITIKDKAYPNKLKMIYDNPFILYAKGNISIINNKSIAIIGCRQATQYGKKISEKLSYDLSVNNINIISGLAVGIDTHAHIGTIKNYNSVYARGKAIAVIGNGIDNIYPNQNQKLANNIIESDGIILSEYIIGTKPEKNNFPERNRLISGLSDGVVVVESKKKGGSLITVEFALEQGKDIYAIPGNIDRYNSDGTNQLIKEGAICVTNVDDILENINN